MERKVRTVKESIVETVHIVRPIDLNSAGRLFGGVLMSWIDEVAALVAKRHSQMNVTTVSVNNLRFLFGAFMKDIVVLQGKLVYVGKTSMEIKVETYVEHLDGTRDLVNRAYLTCVGLGADGKPAMVPQITLETPEEREEWNLAKERKEKECDCYKNNSHS